MSKKVFTLATTWCGHCKQAKMMIENKYPNISDQKYTYFNHGVDDVTDESEMVLDYARKNGVRGVPFSVLIKNGVVVDEVRGYQPDALVNILNIATNSNE